MDITPQDSTKQSISDDQELAKALAGVMPDAPEAETSTSGLNFEETPAPGAPAATDDTKDEPAVTDAALPDVPEAPELPSVDSSTTESTGDLEGIRKDALQELRPLLDKVDLPAEEKFATYLMLIRSTDDRSLIAPAHTAALAIEDESARAEALLNIIKEIDYLSQPTQPSAE